MVRKKQNDNIKNLYGLIGKDIAYSFSREYFAKKFECLKLKESLYANFDLPHIDHIKEVLELRNLKGLNVTIPYKQAIIPYLNQLEVEAERIGAVNTIVLKDNKFIGYNTDCYGFEQSLLPLLKKHHTHALILGTGGASKAIAYVLKKLGISFLFVSRKPTQYQIEYNTIDRAVIEKYKLIINCSPLGTFPNIEEKPNLPYQYVTKQHLFYDLIYNPVETTFLKEGIKKQATIKNGLRMLELQAEKSWLLWNE